MTPDFWPVFATGFAVGGVTVAGVISAAFIHAILKDIRDD